MFLAFMMIMVIGHSIFLVLVCFEMSAGIFESKYHMTKRLVQIPYYAVMFVESLVNMGFAIAILKRPKTLLNITLMKILVTFILIFCYSIFFQYIVLGVIEAIKDDLDRKGYFEGMEFHPKEDKSELSEEKLKLNALMYD